MHHEQLRELCLSFKGVTEDIKWGNDLCFLIGEKMFCVTWLDGPFQASLKVTDEEFEELTARTDIIPAAYLARYKWIQVKNAGALSAKDWERLICQSYELVKSGLTKKKQKEIDG
ncbi:MmcQ/YjbR family DNA-binding protein [soil metagenome]